MGKYEELANFSAEKFRRLTGVKQETFQEMVEILLQEQKGRYRGAGRRSKLCIEDKLLMALEYLREYRTYLHLGCSYGISESACYRACKWVEDTLIKRKRFSLPGKKALLKSEVEYEIVLVDASESPIQRPKKGKNVSTQERKRDIR
jgi:Helix-turn-helix of DDE superfamily endonuclease